MATDANSIYFFINEHDSLGTMFPQNFEMTMSQFVVFWFVRFGLVQLLNCTAIGELVEHKPPIYNILHRIMYLDAFCPCFEGCVRAFPKS
jgi:hypothetical protein